MALSIKDVGARGDGRTLETECLQRAITRCHEQGGGTLLFPAGTYLSGTLELFSNVTLELEAGAVLRGSPRLEDYPPHRFHHNEWGQVRSLLFAIDAENVALLGQGKIDLNGAPFIDFDTPRSGGWFGPETLALASNEQRAEATVEARERPNQLLFFHGCRNFRVEGLTIENSPCWTLTFSDSRDLKIRGVSVYGDLRVPNNDGIHLSACKDVVISDCVISCGDDCIAVTAITKWDEPSERIAVSNCSLVSRSAAVRLGHLASKVKDVVLGNLVIRDSQRGIGIFAGDGGAVENVLAQNLVIETRIVAGYWWGNGEPLALVTTGAQGSIRRVRVSAVHARSENGILIHGHGGNIADVDLVDWRLELAYGKNRPLLGKVIDLQPAAVRPAPDAEQRIPWLLAHEARSISARHVRYGRRENDAPRFSVEALLENSELECLDVLETSRA